MLAFGNASVLLTESFFLIYSKYANHNWVQIANPGNVCPLEGDVVGVHLRNTVAPNFPPTNGMEVQVHGRGLPLLPCSHAATLKSAAGGWGNLENSVGNGASRKRWFEEISLPSMS